MKFYWVSYLEGDKNENGIKGFFCSFTVTFYDIRVKNSFSSIVYMLKVTYL